MVELLLVVPHPDDEVFGAGGILRKMADHGKATATLTLTRGGAGKSLDLCSAEELPELREKELRAALTHLAVSDISIYDFPDGHLQSIPEQELIKVIRDVIERTRPRAILTFSPNGANGHPDHVTTHYRTMAAIEQAQHEVEKIYYYAADRPFKVPGREGWMSPEEVNATQLFPTHYIDVRDYMEAKLRAMGEHQSQALSVMNFMKRLPRRLLIESFYRAKPAYPDDEGSRHVPWL